MSVTYTGDSQSFWECYQQKHCWLELKETEIGQNEGKLSDTQNSTEMKQADKTILLQTHASFQSKGRFTVRAEPGVQRSNYKSQGRALEPQKTIPRPIGMVLFPGLFPNIMKFALLDFETGWDWWCFSSFYFSLSVMGMSIIAVLCLLHHYIL